MIKIPTCLVLGAGASVPYGFPSGIGLRKTIIKDFTNERWLSLLSKLEFEDKDYIASFHTDFKVPPQIRGRKSAERYCQELCLKNI